MPRKPNLKCQRCAKLSSEQAQQLHGPQGDRCWDDALCHKRRSYYRHKSQYTLRRHQKHPPKRKPTQQISVETAPSTYVALHLYRRTKDSPLHALGAELWQNGRPAVVMEPVHCLGLTPSQIQAIVSQVLGQFANIAQMPLRVGVEVELDPIQCPIRPCPLFPESIYEKL